MTARTWAAVLLSVAASAGVALPLHGTAAVPPVPVTTAPAIGAEPQHPASPCTFAPLGATELRHVYSVHLYRSFFDREGWPAETVDPFAPCHVFRSFNDMVDRTDDGGRSFPVVFQSPSVTVPEQHGTLATMQPAAVSYQAASTLTLYDRSGPYGVIRSDDLGAHWAQRDGGLPMEPRVSRVVTVAFAPSDPRIGYAVVIVDPTRTPVTGVTTTVTMLYGTGDGGASWSLIPLDAQQMSAIAVDPRDPHHLFVADQQIAGDQRAPAILESSDAGATWSEHPLTNGIVPVALLVTHPAGLGPGHVRLYMETDASARDAIASTQSLLWWRSFDDAVTWRYVGGETSAFGGTPGTGDALVLAADPENPDDMVLVGNAGEVNVTRGLRVIGSHDGMVTVAQTLTLQPPDISMHALINDSNLLDLSLTADHRHQFFLHYVESGPRGYFDDLDAFRLGALARPQPLAPVVDLPAGVVPPEPATTVPYIGDCTLQFPLLGGLVATSPYNGASSPLQSRAGSLTYDGEFLDYTHDAVTPNTVYRIDPVTCQPAPPLTVVIPPDQGGGQQWLTQLTYDARYVFSSGDVGAILARGLSDARTRSEDVLPVYAIDPLTGAVELAMYLPHGSSPDCCFSFTYDVFRDALWVYRLYGLPGLVAMPKRHGDIGAEVPTCMNDHFPIGDPEQMAAWVVGNDGIVYSQEEDDRTVFRVDVNSCRLLGGFQHDQFSEAPNEDEQLACDPITFGDGSAYAAGGHAATSVIWIRDSAPNTVRAYPIPDGYCPFPTRLTLQPLPTVRVGTRVPLCAVLRRAAAGLPPLPDAAVTFSVDGRPAGQGLTAADGGVCVPAVAPGPSGGHVVRADFAGTHVYLPSHATGPLRTFQLGGGLIATLPAVTLPPPGAGSEPLPVHQSQPVPDPLASSQAQIQTQAQSQTQAQAQSQMQPGLMPQRQRQRQVAVQTSAWRQGEASLLAVAMRQDGLVLASMLAAAVGWAMRRRVQLARRGR